MDGKRFDELARLLATRSDRRGALKRMAGAAAASALALLGLNRTATPASAAAYPSAPATARNHRGSATRRAPAPGARPAIKGRHQTTPAATPTVVLTPTSGKIKTAISAKLTGFRSNETITLKWFDGSASKTIATGLTSSGGKTTITFEAPYAFRGWHVIRATGNRGSTGEAKFAINPSFTLKPKSGAAGDTIKASLSGFASRAKIDVWFFPGETATGSPWKLTTVTVSATGTGAVNIAIPNNASSGLHRIEGREQTTGRLASAKFRVNECATAGDCPQTGNECTIAVCQSGLCSTLNVEAGTPAINQTPGDCRRNVCDGNGQIVSQVDDSDLPDDGNDCTIDTCVNGTIVATPKQAGEPCGTGGGAICNAEGVCVGCNVPADCPGADTECQTRTCISGQCGANFEPNGQVCPGGICDGAGVCIETLCTPNEIRSCYEGPPATENVGICQSGSQSCASDGSAWGPCNNQVLPGVESICNGIDENCDGIADNGVTCPPLPNATSICAGPLGCIVGVCNPGFANCDSIIETGCETNTQISSQHCGACNHPCATGETCTAGICNPTA